MFFIDNSLSTSAEARRRHVTVTFVRDAAPEPPIGEYEFDEMTVPAPVVC